MPSIGSLFKYFTVLIISALVSVGSPLIIWTITVTPIAFKSVMALTNTSFVYPRLINNADSSFEVWNPSSIQTGIWLLSSLISVKVSAFRQSGRVAIDRIFILSSNFFPSLMIWSYRFLNCSTVP